MSINGAPVMAATVVAVDVGKNTAVLSVTDSARQRFLGPVEFAMTAPAVAAVVERGVCCTARRGGEGGGGGGWALSPTAAGV
jgi:transposase